MLRLIPDTGKFVGLVLAIHLGGQTGIAEYAVEVASWFRGGKKHLLQLAAKSTHTAYEKSSFFCNTVLGPRACFCFESHQDLLHQIYASKYLEREEQIVSGRSVDLAQDLKPTGTQREREREREREKERSVRHAAVAVSRWVGAAAGGWWEMELGSDPTTFSYTLQSTPPHTLESLDVRTLGDNCDELSVTTA